MASDRPVHFRFGDSRALCEELTALVLSGAKTATCTALRDAESGAEAMPVVGRRDVATDWDGVPVALVETVEVTVRRFDEVDEDFALAEGENDSLEGWRRDHRRYFERNRGWSPDMALVCERFRLVEICDADTPTRVGGPPTLPPARLDPAIQAPGVPHGCPHPARA